MDGARGGEYLSIDEVARRYQVGRRTVFRLIAARKVQRVKKPGDRRTLISVADADALFRAQSVEARGRR